MPYLSPACRAQSTLLSIHQQTQRTLFGNYSLATDSVFGMNGSALYFNHSAPNNRVKTTRFLMSVSCQPNSKTVGQDCLIKAQDSLSRKCPFRKPYYSSALIIIPATRLVPNDRALNKVVLSESWLYIVFTLC